MRRSAPRRLEEAKPCVPLSLFRSVAVAPKNDQTATPLTSPHPRGRKREGSPSFVFGILWAHACLSALRPHAEDDVVSKALCLESELPIRSARFSAHAVSKCQMRLGASSGGAKNDGGGAGDSAASTRKAGGTRGGLVAMLHSLSTRFAPKTEDLRGAFRARAYEEIRKRDDPLFTHLNALFPGV